MDAIGINGACRCRAAAFAMAVFFGWRQFVNWLVGSFKEPWE